MAIGELSTFEADIKIAEINKQIKEGTYPMTPLPDPGWFGGLQDTILNQPQGVVRRYASPFMDVDTRLGRIDPDRQGFFANLVESVADVADFTLIAAGLMKAGQSLRLIPHPISQMVGVFLHGGALTYAFFSKRKESSKIHQYHGIDKETADEIANYEAASTAFLPFGESVIDAYIKSTAKQIATSAGINIGAGIAERRFTSRALEESGYHEMAQHVRAFDTEMILLDGLTSVFFRALHSPQVRDTAKKAFDIPANVFWDLKDSISERLGYRHLYRGSAPGMPTTPHVENAHIRTMGESIEGILKGQDIAFDDVTLGEIGKGVIHPHEDAQSPHPKGIEMPPHEGLVEASPDRPHPNASELREAKDVIHQRERGQPHPAIADIDEHASRRFSELEQHSPELAADIRKGLSEEVEMTRLIKDKKLYKVAVECFLGTGG